MASLRQGAEAPRRRARARNGACAQESVSQGLGSERGGLARAGAGQGTMADGLLAHATRASAEDLGLTVYLNHHHYIIITFINELLGISARYGTPQPVSCTKLTRARERTCANGCAGVGV